MFETETYGWHTGWNITQNFENIQFDDKKKLRETYILKAVTSFIHKNNYFKWFKVKTWWIDDKTGWVYVEIEFEK